MQPVVPPRPKANTEEKRRPRRRARRSKARSPLPSLLSGLLGVVLGIALVLGAFTVRDRIVRSLPGRFGQSGAEDGGSPYGVDPEVNQEANSAYSLPSYGGDASHLTIDFAPHSGEALPPAELYQRVRDAVVSLTVYAGRSAAYGSGMILTPDGYVLTCAHVVADSQSCTVALTDGRELEAELVALDEQTDLAVLKIDAEGLPTVEFTDSDKAVVGESVYALGDPVRPEFRSTFTDGMISGLNRSVSSRNGVMRLIQITAPVNSGNSGGPVFNAWGQVLGVVNMKINRPDLDVSVENMGMCIPSRTVKSVVEELVRTGSVQRTMLGITCQSINEAQAHVSNIQEGLWITTIHPASDVANHDIQVGDIITAVNGTPVSSVLEFRDATAGVAPGESVTLTLWRDEALVQRLKEIQEAMDSSASVSEPDRDEEFAYHFEKLGDVKVKMVDSEALKD